MTMVTMTTRTTRMTMAKMMNRVKMMRTKTTMLATAMITMRGDNDAVAMMTMKTVIT